MASEVREMQVPGVQALTVVLSASRASAASLEPAGRLTLKMSVRGMREGIAIAPSRIALSPAVRVVPTVPQLVVLPVLVPGGQDQIGHALALRDRELAIAPGQIAHIPNQLMAAAFVLVQQEIAVRNDLASASVHPFAEVPKTGAGASSSHARTAIVHQQIGARSAPGKMRDQAALVIVATAAEQDSHRGPAGGQGVQPATVRVRIAHPATGHPQAVRARHALKEIDRIPRGREQKGIGTAVLPVDLTASHRSSGATARPPARIVHLAARAAVPVIPPIRIVPAGRLDHQVALPAERKGLPIADPVALARARAVLQAATVHSPVAAPRSREVAIAAGPAHRDGHQVAIRAAPAGRVAREWVAADRSARKAVPVYQDSVQAPRGPVA